MPASRRAGTRSVTPLAAAIAAHGLSKAHFTTLLDARARDMEEAPPDSLAALEDYAAGTSGSLNLLALEVLGVRDARAAEAAPEAGIAYALDRVAGRCAVPCEASAALSAVGADRQARR